jgi:MinD superfamily P-loop ATPase
MNIAIASGKGGTGKTTIATNLAVFLSKTGAKTTYLDCDVEEPNGHLFLKPTITDRYASSIPTPIINESQCIVCGECARFCQYKALIRIGKSIMVFPELCHGCGGCTLVCSQHAISEDLRQTGTIECGISGSTVFAHGRLNIGEAMSPPLIRNVLKHTSMDSINIIDAPPGTSCPVITSIRKADFIVLITEPTPFGLNDLGLALDMVRELSVPYGVVINRAEPHNDDAQTFCKEKHVTLLSQIPDNRLIAESYSRGEMILESIPDTYLLFGNLWDTIREQIDI